ncbi:MAG: Imm53 family immunity protein, partial [Pseudomonadota bacterium]
MTVSAIEVDIEQKETEMNRNTLKRLQDFYMSMCDGDWHHQHGIDISNIDNPGWELRVCLTDTYLQGEKFELVKIQ